MSEVVQRKPEEALEGLLVAGFRSSTEMAPFPWYILLPTSPGKLYVQGSGTLCGTLKIEMSEP